MITKPILIFASALLSSTLLHGATYTVTNVNDSGIGSLRWAVTNANANPGLDNINFNIPGPGVHTIRVFSSYPPISSPVLIDGYTQPGSRPNQATVGSDAVLTVQLIGTNFVSSAFQLTADGSMIRGLVINRFSLYGIDIRSAFNIVEGNFLGTTPNGLAAAPNDDGIVVFGNDNQIGGTLPSERNLISGNDRGVFLFSSDRNNVEGNLIGLASSGTNALPNATHGIVVAGGFDNVIGGSTPGSGNVISGNDRAGVYVSDSACECQGSRTLIQGNYIGTDPTGESALGNETGVWLLGSHGHQIGGTLAGQRNVISGNRGMGVSITSGSTSNTIIGNLIGTNTRGTSPVPNDNSGIEIWESSGNRVGGPAAGERNIISGNRWAGIDVQSGDLPTIGNVIQGNYVGVGVGGTNSLPNGTGNTNASGIFLSQDQNTVIGGINAGEGNVISGNINYGVEAYFSDDARIQGNRIGTTATGFGALSNHWAGIYLSDCRSNFIGGPVTAARNLISGNGQEGIVDEFGFENRIIGNYIGVDPTGTNALRNGRAGIDLFGANRDEIGGPAGERNVVAANGRAGVSLRGGAAFNRVRGNFIGTDATGLRALPNGTEAGLSIYSGIAITAASTNTIGGTNSGEGNVIAGNANDGILIFSNASANIVQGNIIGSDFTGTRRLGNRGAGVRIDSANGNLIGGSSEAYGNVIGGNGADGILVTNPGATRNVIRGNFIGVSASGLVALSNASHGIFLATSVTNNTVGGTNSGDGNVIAFNAGAGVMVGGTPPLPLAGPGNGILGNQIFANNGLGIDLGAVGPMLNDFSDSDTGPNNLQNYPVLSSALNTESGTVLSGSLRSAPNTTYIIQIFANSTNDPSGYGEGDQLLGTVRTTTGSGGLASIVATLPRTTSGRYFTATATDPFNNTSEFSPVLTATWIARYDGPASFQDQSTAIAVDADGYIYVTGFSYGTGTNADFVTIKYDGAGNEIWVSRYDGGAGRFDRAAAVVVDGAGHVYVTGESDGTNGKSDYLTIKYNANGSRAWVARFEGLANGYDSPTGLAVDSVGNVVVTGYSQGDSTFDYVTLKYSPAGRLLWSKSYDGVGKRDDWPAMVVTDASGNIYVTGTSARNLYEYATVKYTPAGQQAWAVRYFGPTVNSHAQALALDGAGNVIVTGYSEGDEGTGFDIATVSYAPDGTEQWVARLNRTGNSDERPTSMVVDIQGGVYVTGQSIRSGNSDFVTVKHGTNGILLWAAYYNGLGNRYDVAKAIQLDGRGNVFVTGPSEGSEGGLDYATVKYDSANGLELEAQSYNPLTDGRNGSTALALDSSGSIYVTGWSEGSGGHVDIATVKYFFNAPPPVIIGVSSPQLRWTQTLANGQSYLRLIAPAGSSALQLESSRDLRLWTLLKTADAGQSLDYLAPIDPGTAGTFFRLQTKP